MDPNERQQDEFSLDAILEEYRGFDPEAPEATPLTEAAFMTHRAEATLVDPVTEEPIAPEEPEWVEPIAPEEPETEDWEAALPEDAEEAEAIELEPVSDILEEEDDYVREYRPRAPEAPEPAPDLEPYSEEEEGYAEKIHFARLRSLINHLTVPAKAPETPEPEPEEEDLPLEDEPEEPTQVFHAVAEMFGEDQTPKEIEFPDPEEFWAQVIDDDEEVIYATAESVPEEEAEPIFDDDVLEEPDEEEEEDDEEADDEDEDEYEEVERRSFREAVIRPITLRIAAASVRSRERRRTAREEASIPEELGPEPSAKTAAKFYGQKIGALRRRGRVSLLLSLVLLYIAAGLPTFGLLKSDPRVTAMVCIILLMTVMLLGLDVLTVGILSLIRKRPGAESLVALGCLFSLLDAVLSAVQNTLVGGMPYCVVSAFALTFALLSAKLTGEGLHLSFLALARSRDARILTCGTNAAYDGLTLRKTRRSAEGFIHRSEEPGPDTVLFAVVTPYIIVVGLVLGLLATVLSGSIRNAGHVLAAIFCAALPFASLIVYTLPYRAAARTLQPKGLALAGWSGVSDVGRSKRFIITDQDLFGPNTITIGEGRTILPGMSEAKVVAYTASVVNASGCCLAPAFIDLLRGFNYPLFRVDDFLCEQAGGMSGYINDEEVLFGTSEFMRLKGLRASAPDTEGDTRLFTAINGEIVGSFPVNYQAMRSVQNALKFLLTTRMHPIFAVRDPNIAPGMLRRKFQTQADGFDFPPFQQRYELSDPEAGSEDPISGIVGRSGLAAMLAINKIGRQLYQAVRIGLWGCGIVGLIAMLVMFILCAMGDFATMSPFHLAVFQLVFGLCGPLVAYFAKR